MSDLTAFRDHARRMARGGHKPGCDGRCVHTGQRCTTATERTLWGQLADEIDAYMFLDEPAPAEADDDDEGLFA